MIAPAAALLAAALLAAAAPATAPAAGEAPDQAAVLAAVGELLHAVNTADAALLGRVVLPGASIAVQRYAPDGSLVSRQLTVAQMQASFAGDRGKVDERLQDPLVMVQRDLAHVWSRYTIDVDGKRLHCGVDSFGLARIDGRWRVTSLAWTAEPQGCPR